MELHVLSEVLWLMIVINFDLYESSELSTSFVVHDFSNVRLP